MAELASAATVRIVEREAPAAAVRTLLACGVEPLLARLLAARGIERPHEADEALAGLEPPDTLRGLGDATRVLADAIAAGQQITIVADYDCDGATACAVAVRGLRQFGASVDYLVPNRFEYGYGLTPEIVDLALARRSYRRPELLVTVDNGIASIEGVAHAQARGLRVVVTDHHLPAAELPAAAAIVNPNQPGCGFPSKHLAGVGVMFYVLAALRAELRRRGRLPQSARPLARLLDLVALGTVADVVRLDRNNRVLVAAGLQRIRTGQACAGVGALLTIAGREPRRVGAFDLGFAVGPRINAAGRLADMSVGIECLLTDDPLRAAELAEQLDAINRERREIEQAMQMEASDEARVGSGLRSRSLVVFRPGWHQGVVGLVASRLKERFHRPTIAFAPADADGRILRGSGRSIPGVHLRDTLDLVTKRHPRLIQRFGGHAMAAGLTIDQDALDAFAAAFEEALAQSADAAAFERVLETDGELDPAAMSLQAVDAIEARVWGQGFAPPSFHGVFEVLEQRVVGQRHLKLKLRYRDRVLPAIAFNRTEPLANPARLVYALRRDEYRGRAELSLQVLHAEAD